MAFQVFDSLGAPKCASGAQELRSGALKLHRWEITWGARIAQWGDKTAFVRGPLNVHVGRKNCTVER